MPTVHFEPLMLTGRVYYAGSYEDKSPFAAVFTVQLLSGGRAHLSAAHGAITPEAARVIAQKLQEEWGVTRLDMERHRRPVDVDVGRVSGFGDLE